jgi:hypothetical protein
MSYIDLINRFWSIDLEANFSHLDVHLFFKLLEVNNRLGWKNEFKYPNTRLESEIGSRQKNLIQSRNRLVDFGLITYRKGTTRIAGTYSVLSSNVVTKESNQESNQADRPTKESNQESNLGSNKGCNRKVIRGTLTREDEEKTRLTNKSPTKDFDLSFIDDQFLSLVEGFIDYRRTDLRKPFKTVRGVKMFYGQLVKLSSSDLSAASGLIENAMDNEWQSVYLTTKQNETASGLTKQEQLEADLIAEAEDL